MSAMSRNKGARGERELLKELGLELGAIFTRNLEQTREGGADCLQVKGFAIECKRVEALARPTWWRQAVRQADVAGAEPIVFFRRNREPWHALVQDGSRDTFKQIDWLAAISHIREKWLSWP